MKLKERLVATSFDFLCEGISKGIPNRFPSHFSYNLGGGVTTPTIPTGSCESGFFTFLTKFSENFSFVKNVTFG